MAKIQISLTPKQVENVLLQLQTKKTRKQKADEFSEEFTMFWKRFPYRWIQSSRSKAKVGKYEAWEEWQKLSDNIRQYIFKILPQMRSGEAVPDAWRWLAKKRWTDYELPRKPLSPEAAAIADGALKSVPQEKSMAVKANEQVRKLLGKP